MVRLAPAVGVKAPAVLLTAVLAASMTGCAGDESSPHDAIRDFLVGWQSGDYAEAAARTDGDRARVAGALRGVSEQLDSVDFRFKVGSVVIGATEATAGFKVEVDLGENGPPWRYDGEMGLRRSGGRWWVHWTPGIIHPRLGPGQRLAVTTKRHQRGPMLDRNDEELRENVRVYVAGVIPKRVKDPRNLVKTLAKITSLQEDRLLGRIASSPPNRFVGLATFPETRSDEYRRALEALPGLKIRRQKVPLSVGSPKSVVGTIDNPRVHGSDALGGSAQVANPVGVSGLEKVYEDRLAGAVTTKVVTLDRNGDVLDTLQEWPGRPGQEVRTTLDRRVQTAADRAIIGRGMLVAVEPSTGDILAVGSKGFDKLKDNNRADRPSRALDGRYSPHAAFSIISAAAALDSDFSPETRVPCPPKRTVAGVAFAAPGSAGAPPYTKSFATGCSTATAALARRVDDDALRTMLTAFGIGSKWSLGVPTFGGSAPSPDGLGDKARLLTGRTAKVSPLGMALVAGAVASGTWRPPRLVAEPTVTTDARARPLDPDIVAELRKMMKSPAGVKKKGVHGLDAGGWFLGGRDDLAIAILAKGSGHASATADRFFTQLTDH